MRGRTALWRNRQYNACCQKPLSRDFENHRPASEGAWLVLIGLSKSCRKAAQRSRQVKGLCAAGRPPLYLLMRGPWSQGILWTHAFLRLPWHGWGNEREPLLRKASTRMPLNSVFPRRTAMPQVFLKFFYLSKARRSQALLRILKRHLRQVKDGAFCYRCKGDFPAFR